MPKVIPVLENQDNDEENLNSTENSFLLKARFNSKKIANGEKQNATNEAGFDAVFDANDGESVDKQDLDRLNASSLKTKSDREKRENKRETDKLGSDFSPMGVKAQREKVKAQREQVELGQRLKIHRIPPETKLNYVSEMFLTIDSKGDIVGKLLGS